MKLRKLTAVSCAAMMLMGLAACGNSAATETTGAAAGTETASEKAEESAENTESAAENVKAAEGETYKIGVLQLVQHPALDKANEGFIAALDEAGISYELDQQNASGEQSTCQTIAEKFVNDGVDLIYAIATPAAQAVTSATEEIPVVIAAVTDPESSGLVESNAAPGGNVTGASDLTPVKEQIELLQKLIPDAENVGILFCTAEANSEIQAEMAREALDSAGIGHQDYTVSSSNEIQTVVESMIGKVDAIYLPTDNTIAAGMATVAQVANDNGIPTICGEANMVNAGGLATYGIDYFQHGKLAGERAIEILKDGKNPGELPIAYGEAANMELSVNEETAELLGIDLSVLN